LNDEVLQHVYSMRQELSQLWSRSAASESATAEQTLKQLCDWRARARAAELQRYATSRADYRNRPERRAVQSAALAGLRKQPTAE
jgi:hypothetical protein